MVRTAVRRVSAAVAALTAALACAQAAHAQSPTWKIVQTSTLSAPYYPAHVAADGPTSVWVAGANDDGVAVEHWNGTAWSTTQLPNLPGSKKPDVDGVYAPSASNVWVFGGTQTSAVEQAWAEHWNGTAWSVTWFSDVAPAGFVVTGPSNAYLMGQRFTEGTPYAVRWNGTSWSSFRVPVAVQAAAGTGPNDLWVTDTQELDHWNGTKWTSVDLPTTTPTADDSPLYEQILATSPTDVTVSGVFYSDHKHGTFVLHWNGTIWSQVSDPADSDTLAGAPVSDGSGGLWIPMTGSTSARIGHLTGSTITTQPAPALTGQTTLLTGLASVPGSTQAWGAGSVNTDTTTQGIVLQYAP